MTHLRPWHADDADRLLALLAEDAELARQLPADITEPGRAAQWCAEPNDYDGYWHYAIVDGDAVVGNVAVQCRRRHRVGWVSYWLGVGARGRGLATRACATICDLAHHELDLVRLELGYRLDNVASAAVARRCGFVREGVLRQELEYDGVRHDTAVESRLPGDPVPDVELLQIRD